jgi:hypothetical protein
MKSQYLTRLHAVIQTVEVRLKTYDPVEVQLDVPEGVEAHGLVLAGSSTPASDTIDEASESVRDAGSTAPKRKRQEGTDESAAGTSTAAKVTVMGKSAQAMKGHSAFLTFAMKFLAQQKPAAV